MQRIQDKENRGGGDTSDEYYEEETKAETGDEVDKQRKER